MSASIEATRGVLDDVLAWSRERDYRGHSKHDALNSPLVNALTFNQRFLRLAAIQAFMRFPLNVRGLAGVPRLRNPKGIGLFAHAWFDRAEVCRRNGDAEGERDSLAEAERLLAWLVAYASPWTAPSEACLEGFNTAWKAPAVQRKTVYRQDLEGLGWGYHYPWQDVGFFQPRHFPNRVVSSWIGFAFMRGYEVTGQEHYLLAAREIVRFLLDNPRRLVDEPDQLCLSYVPLQDIDWAVMDVSVLSAGLCVRVASALEEGDAHRGDLFAEASRLVRFVVDKQTDYGGWFYTWPAGDSHIKHDNYHTGIILDMLADTMTYSGDMTHQGAYRKGLDYYREALFEPSGAPRWMNDKALPYDIHGAAAGILAFTRAARFLGAEQSDPDQEGAREALAMADRIQGWTQEHLYSGQGWYYYQRTRWGTKRFNLMRWCNAWMARALSQRLRFATAHRSATLEL